MSNDGDYVERTVIEPATVRREEVHVTRESSNAGWWIAALVAVVAIVGVIFLMSNGNTQSNLQAAHDQGAAEATLANAASNAQTAAAQAGAAAQNAAESTARATENAAQAAADRTAAATQNATDATTTEPAPPQ
jgi:hypothetical protein